jgi:hypothetical protein
LVAGGVELRYASTALVIGRRSLAKPLRAVVACLGGKL